MVLTAGKNMAVVTICTQINLRAQGIFVPVRIVLTRFGIHKKLRCNWRQYDTIVENSKSISGTSITRRQCRCGIICTWRCGNGKYKVDFCNHVWVAIVGELSNVVIWNGIGTYDSLIARQCFFIHGINAQTGLNVNATIVWIQIDGVRIVHILAIVSRTG